eukprot:TRINITY_DN493_c0_g1_i1.p1 TRINITY_DN493_c0_g1~~TRINITY_DN493_c0_g1_i1.p1  ORF type:complete len:239 (-),score=55.02 TRINITY_DN493_c0_g1_i1:82-798(-)
MASSPLALRLESRPKLVPSALSTKESRVPRSTAVLLVSIRPSAHCSLSASLSFSRTLFSSLPFVTLRSPLPSARCDQGGSSHRLNLRAQNERSYVMIKPDGVQRGLVGEIISRFEKKGFILRGLKLFQCPTDLAKEHYKDLSEKPFYGKLVDYITSGPVVAMVWEGQGVVTSARKIIGTTNPLAAEPGTIRGDFAVQVGRNVVHGSDSPENGEREIGLWFDEKEISEWQPTLLPWLRE